MSTFPSVVSSFTDPLPAQKLNNPSHSAIHSSVNAAVEQLETFIGTLSSAAGTLMYDIRAAGSNGGGHVQTANKGGTGQTSFTKGDVLVATSSSVLAKLAVGVDGQALLVDSSVAAGVKWGQPGTTPTLRVYEYSSSSYTWTKPTNPSLLYAVVELVGGGAGGGSVASGGIGGGGGAGGYGKRIYAATALPTAASVIVGAGGASNVFGGTTYFGSVLTASGGSPGAEGSGGSGGSVLSSATLKLVGGSGETPENGGSTDMGGLGGDSFYGFGGIGGAEGAGGSGVNYGAGGGGAESDAGSAAGGNGAGGVVIITEY